MVWVDSFARSPDMCSANKDEVTGRVWSLSPCPSPPQSAWTRRQPHLTPLSIAGVPGEVSRQKVACFFPAASHCCLGAAGSRGRQGGNCPTLNVSLSRKRGPV